MTVCIGVPGRIIELGSDWALIDFGGVKRKAGTQLVEDLNVGDYVLIHAGYVLHKIDEEDARETLALLTEIYESWDEETP